MNHCTIISSKNTSYVYGTEMIACTCNAGNFFNAIIFDSDITDGIYNFGRIVGSRIEGGKFIGCEFEQCEIKGGEFFDKNMNKVTVE